MKKRITAIILTLCFTFILMPFSVVNAMVTNNYSGNIAKGNTIIGRFVSYILEPDNGETYLSSYVFTDHSYNYQSGSVSYVNFNSYCNGSIRINITDLDYATAVWIESDSIGSWTIDYTNKYIDINLVNTNNFRIYTMSTNTSINSYISGYDATSVEIIETVEDNYLTYQVPVDRLMAFNFFLKLGDYIHYDNMNPYPYISLNNTSTAGFVLNDGDELIFAYFTTMTGPPDRSVKGAFNITTSGPGSYTLTETQLAPIDKYQITGGEGLVCAKLTYSGGNSRTFTFQCRTNGRLIRPIYIGKSTSYMSEETKSFLGLDNLVNNPNEDMDDIADDLGDLHDEENDIIGCFESDLTDFNTDMDLDDYDFITDLNDSNTYFKMVLDDVFTNSSSVRAFWVIPLILVIITALLGR